LRRDQQNGARRQWQPRHLHPQRDGFVGTIKTLTLNVKARFVPTEGDKERGLTYRIVAAATEFGAASSRVFDESVERRFQFMFDVALDHFQQPFRVWLKQQPWPMRRRCRLRAVFAIV
jgi:uncharacterized protein (DUF736 family)